MRVSLYLCTVRLSIETFETNGTFFDRSETQSSSYRKTNTARVDDKYDGRYTQLDSRLSVYIHFIYILCTYRPCVCFNILRARTENLGKQIIIKTPWAETLSLWWVKKGGRGAQRSKKYHNRMFHWGRLQQCSARIQLYYMGH